MTSGEAPPPRKGGCHIDEYVAESRPEGTEKTDMVGEAEKSLRCLGKRGRVIGG
jgi:hypothetical protein